MQRLAPTFQAAFAFGLSRDDVFSVMLDAPPLPYAFEWIPDELARIILLREEATL